MLDQHENVLAAGAVFQKGKHAYFFSGGVIEAYRGRGLWKKLLYERQKLSQAMGAEHWIYSSSNEFIKQYSQMNFENICYSK